MRAVLALVSLLLLLLALSSAPSATSAAPTYTDPEYTYHIALDQSLASQTLPSDLVWSRSTVSDVDDCYYQSIDLAFPFPYWLRSFTSLSISPNGAVYIPPDPIGCTCRTYINGIVAPTFMGAVPSCSCCFDNAFFDLIAASLTDLNPSVSTNGRIEWAQTNTSFYVNYVNIQLYTDQWNINTQGPVPSESFSVELRSNGRIITRYTKMDDVFTYGNYVQDRSRGTWVPRNWMVGLRQADPRFPTSTNPSSRVTRNKVQWNATTNAVYPPRPTIRSGTTINYWPMGNVACNSPSIGTPSRTDTFIYLNDFAQRAANFDLRCWVSGSGVTLASVPAVWNSTLGALKCTLPSYAAPTVMTVNVAETTDGIFLPMTAMSFRIYADSDPVILRYDALASRTGGGSDLRVCYECARLRPQQCQAPLLQSMCNTPQIGSTDGTTPTVVIPSGYSWSDRLASGALKQLWCVWSNATSPQDARDPNGLNPFLFDVTWIPARLYSNASGWVICDPPISSSLPGLGGTSYNLSLAEGNFVWSGGLGAVGGGWGYASPLDNAWAAEMSANARAAMQAAAGNQQLLMSYTLVLPSDARLVAYQSDDYLNDYLLSPSSNFSAGVGSKAGLNLKQLCADCRSRVASLAADSSTAASSISGATGVCLDAAAASVNLCISPPFGDAAGAATAGANATFNLFLSNYPAHIRRSLFALSCALQPYYIRNDSSVANVTVVNGTRSHVELRTTYRISYLSVGAPTFVPLLFDSASSLYSCQAPSLASLGLGALAGVYANVSQDSVQVLLAENNLVLPGFPLGIVYTFLADPADARLQALEAGRRSIPQSPPWSFCFSCDPLFRSVSFTPNAGFITDSRGLSYCFGTAAVNSLPSVRICASPGVGGKQPTGTSNNTVSLWTTPLYPLATRLVMSSVYCVFALPATYTTTFNATTNITTTVLNDPAIPPLWVPVSFRNLDQRSATCVPPAFGSVFGSNLNLTVTLAEYGLMLPFAPQLYRFLDENEDDLVILRQHQALLRAASQALDGSSFSPQQFCTDCHATAVLAGPTFVPMSPVGVAGLCYADCAQRWNGAAVYDDCGVCSAGHSGHTFNDELDCMSVCSGPFRLQSAGPFFDCRCENRAECFNISTQPLVGVSILPDIPGRPRATPLDLAAVSSQQYLLRSFPLGSGLVVNDPSASRTPDPDFNSTGFLRFAPSNWLGSGDGSGFAADPYPIAVGFNFPFFERVYSTLYLSSSGAILFAPQASYPDVCKRAPSPDPRVHNLGLLAALFAAPGDFATGCAEASAILAYATFLDPSANISSPFPGTFALGSMPTQTPAATIAYMAGPAATSGDAAAVAAGQWISFKFENVPYNFPAFAPWAARYASAPAVADIKPPLYSFQITLYASGRISLKYLAVTDPADPAASPAFNTTDGFKRLVVGLLDRKLPSSALSQSAPQDSYVAQLERSQGAAFGLQGALALRTRQQQWLPNSSVSIGVFPPRSQVASAIQQVFCPFALNACAYPSVGPSTGGTLVSVSLYNLGMDLGCIERLLSIQCVFGDVAAPSQATYNPLTNTLQCLSPAGTALVTVPLLLMEGGSTLITTNRLFWTWFAPGDSRLNVREYDERANTTWIGHIAGAGETAGVAFAQTVGSHQREMCTACHAFNPGYCVADCNQVYFGTAFVDDCGNCTAGQTGRVPNFARDCGGVCSGLAHTFTSPSGGETQCACAPLDDPLCAASAIPAMNPAPSQTSQFVYNVRTAPAAAAISGPMEPLPVDWDGMPVGSVEVLSPLPEYLSVPLPFLFPFYAQLQRSVQISGWGALLLEEMPQDLQAPCLARGFETLFRNTTTTLCPFQLVAGSLMEYDLSAAGSSIKYYPSASDSSRSACFTVVWKNMTAASDASLHYTFAVQLCDAGQITLSYREVHDPNAAARAAAPLPPVKFVPNATVSLPPAPAYALSAPFWLAGVMQSWYTSSGVQFRPPGMPFVRNPDGSVLSLSRENVVPFPFSQTQNTMAVIEQRAFLGLSGPASPLGTFPSRAQLHISGTGSQWQYCRIGVDFCASVAWGPVEGGTVVRIFGSDWGCRSFRGISNETHCCAEQLQLECDFGGVRVPANFSSTLQAVQCVSPPAVLPNSTVVLSLRDSGRRIGMRKVFVFRYNVTAAELAAPTNPDLVGNALWYNTDASICSTCASVFSPLLLKSNAFCATDCYGDFRGSAAVDGCGVCSGGNTGHVAEADRDCRGECFGPFRRVSDSDGPLLATATSQVRSSLAGQCICIDSSAVAAGLPSCGYYPVLDGPIQASQVFRFAEYEFMLVALAAAGIVGAVAWQVFMAIKYGAVGGGGAAPGAGAAPPPPPPLPPAPSAAQRRAARAAAAGLMGAAGGLVPAPAEPAAAVPAPAPAAASSGAPSRRRAAAAAAASPAMSDAASAALGGGPPTRPARVHTPPASHYQYSAAPRQ